jgi:hypothetical protein
MTHTRPQRANVSCGSLGDISRPRRDVRFTLESRHSPAAIVRPLSARSGREQTQQGATEGTRTYSITSSAVASSDAGMVIPSAFAVLRLMCSSTFVDCWTGKSAGLSPFKMRPV